VEAWLAGGDLDELRAGVRGAVEDLVERHALAAVERVLGVARHAAQRAAGQPHERARQPRPGALALDGVEDLRDAEEIGGRCLLVHYGIEPPAWSNVPGKSRNFGRGRGRPFRPSAPPGRPPYLPTATRVGELRVHCGRGRSRRGRLHGPRGTPSPSPMPSPRPGEGGRWGTYPLPFLPGSISRNTEFAMKNTLAGRSARRRMR